MLATSILALLVRPGLIEPPELPNRSSEALTLNYERLNPAGMTAVFNARALDVAIGKKLYVKEHSGMRVLDGSTLKELARVESKGGGSLTGLELSPDRKSLLYTNTDRMIHVFSLDAEGMPKLDRDLVLTKDASFPCGLRFAPDGKSVWVCLSLKNQVAQIAWPSGELLATVGLGVAPYEVAIAPDGRRIFVSCQGGRRAKESERSAKSAGSPIPVDERGIASSGIVSVIENGKVLKEIEVGLQPSALAWVGGKVAVANANGDSVSLIDPKSLSVERTIDVKPDRTLPFGSMPNGLLGSPDGKTLYVSLAGNNAVAVFDCRTGRAKGHIPTAWYPGALAWSGEDLVVANVKGVGSVAAGPDAKKRNSWELTGAIQRVPSTFDLKEGSLQVRVGARVREVLAAQEYARRSELAKPVPVPRKLGDLSTLNHVIYVIKENRTYDQIFGDMPEGDGDKSLCTFGEAVTPNHHALAREFVLLDNYYCNGVCSADGHAWAIEGNVTPYLEREFGGFARSYDYGTDPITYSASGFIWEPILAKGLSFRNFGELDLAEPPSGWKQDGIWRTYANGRDTVFSQRIDIERLLKYSSRDFPGWNMAIPDQIRIDRFLKEFRGWEKAGAMPNFVIVYLPQDHTAGTSPGYPKTASYVADNDLALGKLVDAVSHSQFWKDTVIFANEDDPQAGYDHVDGNRSLCLVASPYAKRGKTVSRFYNQNSVLHTILRIFRLPALNQQVARAPLMTECFLTTPDLSPFSLHEPQVDLDAVNPSLDRLAGRELQFAKASQGLGFRRPDFGSPGQDDLLNRIIWASRKGFDKPYPAKFAGSHGRGLAKRGLKRSRAVGADD